MLNPVTTPDEERVKFDPLGDLAAKVMKQLGVEQQKDNTSIAMLRQDSEFVFRVQCNECIKRQLVSSVQDANGLESAQFDIFGRLYEAKGDEPESPVMQRLLEHFTNCSSRGGRVQHTFLHKHDHLPIFKVTVTWE